MLSIYKAVIFVCLSVCLCDHNSGTPGPICLNFKIFNWGTRETHGDVFSLVLRYSKFSGLTFDGKTRQHWVFKLV